MSAISVDHLMLNVSGISQSQGKRLAMRIAEGLQGAVGSADLENLQVNISAIAGESAEQLDQRIIDEVLREIRKMQ